MRLVTRFRSPFSLDLSAIQVPNPLGPRNVCCPFLLHHPLTNFPVYHVAARHSTTARVYLKPSSTASAPTSEVWFFVSRHLHSKRDEGEYLGLQVTRASQESEGVAARPLVDEAVGCHLLVPIVVSAAHARVVFAVHHDGRSLLDCKRQCSYREGSGGSRSSETVSNAVSGRHIRL